MTKKEGVLVKETLVREIRDASRWSAVIEAWEALLMVNSKIKALEKEQEILKNGNPGQTKKVRLDSRQLEDKTK